jgi:hypothetical protein
MVLIKLIIKLVITKKKSNVIENYIFFPYKMHMVYKIEATTHRTEVR